MNGEIILNSSLVFIGFVLVGGLLYSLVSAKQLSKRRRELEKLHQNLKVGAEIMFSGGLTGKISQLDEEFLLVDIADQTTIRISRYAVTNILS